MLWLEEDYEEPYQTARGAAMDVDRAMADRKPSDLEAWDGVVWEGIDTDDDVWIEEVWDGCV